MNQKMLNRDNPMYRIKNLGVNAVSDAELISIITGKDVDTSRKILGVLKGDISNINYVYKNKLLEIPKVGDATIEKLRAAYHINRITKDIHDDTKYNSPAKLYDLLKNYFYGEVRELFIMVLLTRRLHLKSVEITNIGSDLATLVDIKGIMKRVIEERCSAVAVAHNHPSGNPKPSDADDVIKKKIETALKFIDVELVDCMIWCEKGRYYSYTEEGKL